MINTYEYLLTDLATYTDVVHEHRHEGWRLMRIAVPEIGTGKDWRLIFERERLRTPHRRRLATFDEPAR